MESITDEVNSMKLLLISLICATLFSSCKSEQAKHAEKVTNDSLRKLADSMMAEGTASINRRKQISATANWVPGSNPSFSIENKSDRDLVNVWIHIHCLDSVGAVAYDKEIYTNDFVVPSGKVVATGKYNFGYIPSRTKTVIATAGGEFR